MWGESIDGHKRDFLKIFSVGAKALGIGLNM